VFNENWQSAGEDGELFRRMTAAHIDLWFAPRAVMHHVVPAYRLEDEYLRWKSMSYGHTLAQGVAAKRGLVPLLWQMGLRAGHSLLVSLPRMLWARWRSCPAGVQAARCMMWRTEGYARFTLHWLAPRLFSQREFRRRLEFRSERELFSEANG
jgi:hypothetical protein